MNELNDHREIFRPTDKQRKRIDKLMTTGDWKHRSELLRRILEIGLNDLEKKHR